MKTRTLIEMVTLFVTFILVANVSAQIFLVNEDESLSELCVRAGVGYSAYPYVAKMNKINAHSLQIGQEIVVDKNYIDSLKVNYPVPNSTGGEYLPNQLTYEQRKTAEDNKWLKETGWLYATETQQVDKNNYFCIPVEESKRKSLWNTWIGPWKEDVRFEILTTIKDAKPRYIYFPPKIDRNGYGTLGGFWAIYSIQKADSGSVMELPINVNATTWLQKVTVAYNLEWATLYEYKIAK